ncbi:MAG: 30S ribosomal protein S3, partial [bacterium]|nr:30S ribosomal protein S3 [bacterium]
MGRKVHPRVYRLAVSQTWPSTWFARGKDYRAFLKEDVTLRRYITRKYKTAGIAGVDIERQTPEEIEVTVHAGKPGIIISRGGTGIEELTKYIQKELLSAKRKVRVNVVEVKRPALSSQIVAENISADLEKRLPFRRVMKQAIQRVLDSGGQGVKVMVGGRLNGAEISRTEKLVSGKVPLSTLRANIEFGRAVAHMTYGVIGIKVWI